MNSIANSIEQKQTPEHHWQPIKTMNSKKQKQWQPLQNIEEQSKVITFQYYWKSINQQTMNFIEKVIKTMITIEKLWKSSKTTMKILENTQ